jgi:gamma-glutamyltranspeptidase / glutathione hydrolase
VLVRMLHDGLDPQDALDAPRFRIDWGSEFVRVEGGFDPSVAAGLRARGHKTIDVPARAAGMCLAHAIMPVASGYAVATDPRAEGAALGL